MNQLTTKDRTYFFGVLPATQALMVEVAIARVIGEPLFKAFTESKKGAEDKATAESAGAAAVGMLLSKMDNDELLKAMNAVFTSVTYSEEGKPPSRINIDATFTGRNKELWEVFIGALKFNFSEFFPAGLFNSLPASLKA